VATVTPIPFDEPPETPTTTTSRPVSPQRSLRRRRSLPGGRAVIGGLLVTAAVLGVFVAGNRQGDGVLMTSHVVARTAVAAGSVLSAEDLEIQDFRLSPGAARRTFSDTAPLVGAVVLHPLGSGDLLRQSDVDGPAGTGPGVASYREVVVGLPRLRGEALALRPGDLVDVLATDGNGTGARTSVVATDLAVLRVVGLGADGLSVGGEISVVLAIGDGSTATAVVHAMAASEPTVVKSTRSVDDPLPDQAGKAESEVAR